ASESKCRAVAISLAPQSPLSFTPRRLTAASWVTSRCVRVATGGLHLLPGRRRVTCGYMKSSMTASGSSPGSRASRGGSTAGRATISPAAFQERRSVGSVDSPTKERITEETMAFATEGTRDDTRETTSLIGSDKVEATPVYRSNGDRVGQIERLMID